MIRLENVTKTYDDNKTHALDHVNINIKKGEFVFIVGDSGAGKSTLFKLLIKELQPTSGDIYVNGKCITRLRRRKIPMLRRDIGVVFQDFRLLKDRNVYENIAFAQRAISAPPAQIKKNVAEVLTLAGISEKYRSFPDQLSGVMRAVHHIRKRLEILKQVFAVKSARVYPADIIARSGNDAVLHP